MGKRKIGFGRKYKKFWTNLADKASFALVGFQYLLKKPKYLACFGVFTLVLLYILAQLQDSGVNWGLLWSGLPFGKKMIALGSTFASIGKCFTSLSGLLLVLLALMQSLCVLGIIFAIRHRQKDAAIDHASTGSIASILAIVTLGCPTCGVTLLTPILTMFAGAGAVALAKRLGIILMILAFILLLYTLIQLGYLIFVNVSTEHTKEQHE